MSTTASANDIPSELVEPFAAMLIGKMWTRVEKAKETGDRWQLEDAYNRLWFASLGLERIAVAVQSATHFSVASSNNLRRLALLIEHDLGIDVHTHPSWTR